MDARSLKELGLLEVSRLYRGDEQVGASAPVPPAETATNAAASAGWDELKALVADCRACGLCKQRKQAVFGVGAQAGPWLFVGEGPGADEDEQGEPFVGQAGRLLDSMLAAIGCRRGMRRPGCGALPRWRPVRGPQAQELKALASQSGFPSSRE